MQTYQIKTKKENIIGTKMNDAMDKFLSALWTDKRLLYIDDSELIGSDYHVSYCHEYLLEQGNPDWMDIQIPKSDLVAYILENGLNKWESISISPKTGRVVNEEREQHVETFLLEMDSIDRNYMIREYLEKTLKS